MGKTRGDIRQARKMRRDKGEPIREEFPAGISSPQVDPGNEESQEGNLLRRRINQGFNYLASLFRLGFHDTIGRPIAAFKAGAKVAFDNFILGTPGSDGELAAWDSGELIGQEVRYSLGVSKSGNQSINDSTDTAITWDTEQWDDNFSHSTSSSTDEFVIPVDGAYDINGILQFANAAGLVSIRLYVNGSFYSTLATLANSVAASFRVPFSTTYKGTTGQILTLRARQTSGIAINLIGGSLDNTHARISLKYRS